MTSAEPGRLKVLRVVIGLNQGGVQQGVLNLCRGLDPVRFEPIACAIENSGAIGAEIEKAGFEVILLGYKRQAWKTIRALARIIRERQIDIVHASSYHPALYARIAGLLAGRPVMLDYEHTIRERKRLFRLLLSRWLDCHTDAHVAVARQVAEHVRDWYGYAADKVHVIHNGVDTDRFRPAADRAAAKAAVGLDPTRPVVGMVARLDPLKGCGDFFQAVAALRDRFDAQWLVVGAARNRAEEEAVMADARRSGVLNCVQFLGLRRDIPELLAAFDLYVFPTLKEGFPNSLLEAMAAGCAVVASDFPGNLEVARHERNALIVPMHDAEALTGAMQRLLQDGALATRLGIQARSDVETDFSLQAYARKMAALYEALWADRRK
ncbi:MAG: glycosyltransferase [Pseudomonadota bacterium]|nr:glycosyltransferase [Pseudomonadota bacterium]MDP1903376.1 glycosyltransferase [Pseudomonadota bacterium]MDP2352346.1 glycosyltransferase [Pseudomonadota bacterium]